jgi:uncharacterized protein with ACT and thioredoxin-like domain
MATYQITINEKMTLGKSLLTLLQSVPQAVTFEKSRKKEEKKSWLYYELEGAFNDVRLMREGKKKKKTLDELIDELRNSTN